MTAGFRTYSVKLNENGSWGVYYTDDCEEDTIVACYTMEDTAISHASKLIDAEPLRIARALEIEKKYQAMRANEIHYNTLENWYNDTNRYYGD